MAASSCWLFSGGRSCRGGLLAAAIAAFTVAACDSPSAPDPAPETASTAAGGPAATAPAAPAPPEPPHAPEIIVDRANVAVGKDRLATGEPGLADKVTALVQSAPAIAGQVVDVVAMRNAKPSQVEAAVAALRAAKATAVTVKTQARDDTTQTMRVSFTTRLADCAVATWIGKDASIAVWPAGGGRARRLGHGLAGPDMTLGTDAIRTLWAGCNASEIAIGADDTMTWGLVFDLATNALQAPGARVDAAVLMVAATPGKRVELP